ncbi:MAG: hypothetical protein F6K11_31560 [Leptolyngbya sp. SIO3F4]|nr:hypothetical protein [Leptolyngbya sp. SIO3F4]
MQAFKYFLGHFLGKSRYLIASAFATTLVLAFHPSVQAASSATGGNAVSLITILFILVGIVISVLYIKAMLTVLNEAADSYQESEEESAGSYYAAPVWGAAVAGIAAALVIWSYGMSPSMLYLGPILAMISPAAILYCMAQDIKNFKATQTESKESPVESFTGLRS